MPSRRTVLRTIGLATTVALAGCPGTDDGDGPASGTDPPPEGTRTNGTPTTAEPTSTPTATGTPEPKMAMPVDCGPLPDNRELPSLPAQRTRSTVETFVREFERAYTSETFGEGRRVGTIGIWELGQTSNGYYARVRVKPAVATAAPGEPTPTELPTDGGFVVDYRIGRHRVYRKAKYFMGGTAAEDCWIVPIADGGD